MKAVDISELTNIFENITSESVGDFLNKELKVIVEGADPYKDNSEYASAIACTIPISKLKSFRNEFIALKGQPVEKAYDFLKRFLAATNESIIKNFSANVEAYHDALYRTKPEDMNKTLVDIAVGMGVALSALTFANNRGCKEVDRVYMGNPKGKGDEISKFFVDTDFMKDYNSSDITLYSESAGYFGISVKKMTKENATPPTVANNKLEGFIIANSEEGKKVNIAMNELFDTEFESTWKPFFEVNKELLKSVGIDVNGTAKDIYSKVMKLKKSKEGVEVYRKIEAQSNDWQKTHPAMLLKIARLIDSNKEWYIKSLIQALFRTKLKELEQNKFYFALVNGIGNFEIDKQSKVKTATCSNRIMTFKNISEFIGEELENVKNYDLKFNEKTLKSGKLEDDTAQLESAGIKFQLQSITKKVNICDIVFRWIGFSSKNKLPVLQAYFTREFEHSINQNKNESTTVEEKSVLLEAKKDAVAVTFGRMNPPTIGHKKLVNKLAEVAAQYTTRKGRLYTSHSSDPVKNPLGYEEKIQFLDKAFGDKITIAKSSARSLIEVLSSLNGKVSDVFVVVGSDRVQEFETLLNRYNGVADKKGNVAYTFDSINIVSAGDRDADDPASSASASKARAFVKNDDREGFANIVPFDKETADELFNAVKTGMGINERTFLDVEATLNEGAIRKNTHQTHLEDLILLGVDGIEEFEDKIEKYLGEI